MTHLRGLATRAVRNGSKRPLRSAVMRAQHSNTDRQISFRRRRRTEFLFGDAGDRSGLAGGVGGVLGRATHRSGDAPGMATHRASRDVLTSSRIQARAASVASRGRGSQGWADPDTGRTGSSWLPRSRACSGSGDDGAVPTDAVETVVAAAPACEASVGRRPAEARTSNGDNRATPLQGACSLPQGSRFCIRSATVELGPGGRSLEHYPR